MTATAILTKARAYVGMKEAPNHQARDLVDAIGDTAPPGSFNSVMDAFAALHQACGDDDLREWCFDKTREQQLEAIDKAIKIAGAT